MGLDARLSSSATRLNGTKGMAQLLLPRRRGGVPFPAFWCSRRNSNFRGILLPGIGRRRHSLACGNWVRRAWRFCVQVADSLAVGCAPDADMAREVCDKNALAIVSEYSPEWQITGAIQRAVLATISIPDDNCIIPAARYQAAIMPVTD